MMNLGISLGIPTRIDGPTCSNRKPSSICPLPSGKRLHNEVERSTMLLMAKSTISMAIFQSFIENHHVSWLNPLFLWPFSMSQTVSSSAMGSSAQRAAPSGVLDDAMRSRDIGQHGVADLGSVTCHWWCPPVF